MSLDPFNEFLLTASGVTGETYRRLWDNKEISSAFFQPYKSTPDFFVRAASIVAAPVCLTIIALEAVLASFAMVIHSIVQLCVGNSYGAKESIGGALTAAMMVCIAIPAALISPILNLIDWVVGGVVSLTACCTEEETFKYGYGQ